MRTILKKRHQALASFLNEKLLREHPGQPKGKVIRITGLLKRWRELHVVCGQFCDFAMNRGELDSQGAESKPL